MKKTIFVIMGCIIVFLLSYWGKCQLRINFSEWSLSSYFPFKYLQRAPVSIIKEAHEKGILFRDTFEIPFWSQRNWGKVWSRERGMVEAGIDRCVKKKGSWCLRVKSKSKKDWAYPHVYFIRVNQGDIFYYKARVIKKGEGSVYLRIVTYDENMRVLNWNYAIRKISQDFEWMTIEHTFTVTDPIKYIRFNLSGVGLGEVWVDDVGIGIDWD